MGLDIEKFTRLGRAIEATYRRCHYNPAEFPAIATDALEGFDGHFEFDPGKLSEFFREGSIGQQARRKFSDLPITVHREREFYIEVLVWTNASTSIHQHGFSGAFRVVDGSSVHTTFSFEPARSVSHDLVFGSLTWESTQYLPRGTVLPIIPGNSGTIHRLFHLENPSISLVVRTRGHELHVPQYAYYPPGVCANSNKLRDDEQVLLFLRLVRVTGEVNAEGLRDLWAKHILSLDLPRMAHIYLFNSGQFPDQDVRETFEAEARKRYGELFRTLEEAARRYEQLRQLAVSRRAFADPELRFLVALLMNVADRTTLLDIVRARFPDRDPVACCADWLVRLGQTKTLSSHRLAEVVRKMDLQPLSLGYQLGASLPAGTNDEAARALFRSAIAVGPERANAQQELVSRKDLTPEDVEHFEQRIRQLDVIRPLLGPR